MKRFQPSRVFALTVSLVVLAACGGTSTTPTGAGLGSGPLLVGVIAPFTGVDAGLGPAYYAAAKTSILHDTVADAGYLGRGFEANQTGAVNSLMGPLARCHAVELRGRGTCPGSPGYVVWSEPGQLPVLPAWIAALAGPPPMPVTSTRTGHGSGGGQARLRGIVGRLLAAQRGERNRLLFWASLRIGELVAEGDLDAAAAGQALTEAAAQVGLVGEDGQRAVAATIRSGFQRMGVAYEPPR